jgi:diguanylate cyclase (GGDEF)-like protein/PAS domain S-box-containing protein
MDAAERHVLEVVPVALQVWDAVGDELTLRYANAEARGQALPDCAEAVRAAPSAGDLEHDGASWHVESRPLGDGAVIAAYWNVTQYRRAVEQMGRDILAGLQEGVLVVDTDARITVANAAAAELCGVPLSELRGRSLSAIPVDLLDDRSHLVPEDQLPLMRALRGEQVRGQVVRFVRRDGSVLWVEVRARSLHAEDGSLYGAVASYDDVTVRVEEDRRTRHEADHDALTGLANRRALERTLGPALVRAGARGRAVAVIMLDLDGFKAINDTHGHAAGDEALREVARRLRRCVRERDLVARLGGDEFVVVLSDHGERSGAVQDTVARIGEALAERFEVAGTEVTLGAAVGVAAFPADAAGVAGLLAHADRAMYAAKGASLR